MNKAVLVVGATSPIARATAAAFARRGHDLCLAGRDAEELRRIGSDMHIRFGVKTSVHVFDACAREAHGEFVQDVYRVAGDLAGVLLAFGYLPDAQQSRQSPEAVRIVDQNFTGAVSLLSHLSSYFEERKTGFIVGISSVAGDRGRQSNYVYGAAKAGLTTYLQGLRNRLFSSGVHVMTVKPGFVDTAMTFGMPGLFLVASPEKVGERIVQSLQRSRNVVYVPWFWCYIMLVIRHIPEFVFKRLKL